ncbi:MAG: type III pantothenate kinase [Pseudomonadota bacterium]
MNLLTIDIGNTNITCGLFKGKTLLKKWRIPNDRSHSASSLGKRLKQSIGVRNTKNIEGACICSVVPKLNHRIRNACSDALGIKPLFVNWRIIGMPIKKYNKKQLGVDRIVAAYAAYEKYRKALIVIDAGSAITIDLVTKQGEFSGGVIVPGLTTSAKTLESISTKLPYVKPSVVKHTKGKSTKEAISAGLFHGYAGLVDHLVKKISRQVRTQPLVIATGGEAALLKRACTSIDRVHDDLILEGLRVMWERNAITPI